MECVFKNVSLICPTDSVSRACDVMKHQSTHGKRGLTEVKSETVINIVPSDVYWYVFRIFLSTTLCFDYKIILFHFQKF